MSIRMMRFHWTAVIAVILTRNQVAVEEVQEMVMAIASLLPVEDQHEMEALDELEVLLARVRRNLTVPLEVQDEALEIPLVLPVPVDLTVDPLERVLGIIPRVPLEAVLGLPPRIRTPTTVQPDLPSVLPRVAAVVILLGLLAS